MNKNPISELTVGGDTKVFDYKGEKLSSAGYRFLIHLLKGNGDGGTSLDVAEAVWFYDGEYLKKMRAIWKEHVEEERSSRDPFDEDLMRRIKKEKTNLQHIIRHYLRIELGMDTSKDVSHHIMKEVPKFCLIEIVS